MTTKNLYDIYSDNTTAQIIERAIERTIECMDQRFYSAARVFLEDAEEAIMILNRIVDNIESVTQNRIIMMQERATAEGVAIALNPGYSEDDLDVTAAELSYVISRYRE